MHLAFYSSSEVVLGRRDPHLAEILDALSVIASLEGSRSNYCTIWAPALQARWCCHSTALCIKHKVRERQFEVCTSTTNLFLSSAYAAAIPAVQFAIDTMVAEKDPSLEVASSTSSHDLGTDPKGTVLVHSTDSPTELDEKHDDENAIIRTGADAALHLLPMRDDFDPALTFRSLFLATGLAAFQAVMYQIYMVHQTWPLICIWVELIISIVQADSDHHPRHFHRYHWFLCWQRLG